MTVCNLLAGVRVVEVGTRMAVAACGNVLAMLGAEVVRLADGGGDSRRSEVLATGKRRVAMSSARLDEGVQALLSEADILLTSSDVDAVIAGRAQGQIRCDLTAFGTSGPFAGRPLPDELVQGWAGVADTTGDRQGPPEITGAPFVSMEAGVYAAAAVLAALFERDASGEGQEVEIALYDVGVNALLTFVPLVTAGLPATRNGNRHPTMTPWNSYRASDGRWVLICAPTDAMWAKLCALMDRPALAEDPRFDTTTARLANVADIDAVIGAWVGGLPADRVVEIVNGAGLPASPILTIGDLESEPNVVHRGLCRRDPASGLVAPGNVFRATQWQDRAARQRKSAAVSPASDNQGPLSGLRIVEIGMNTVAPLAGRQLGALGADVIKIEPPTGDTNRHNAPLNAAGASYVFMLSNTDKRGLVLDLKTPADREVLFDLLSTADALIENLKPGALEKLGLGAEAVRERFPHLVYCSVNGFGFDTVYPGRPALDTVIQAMSGALDVTRVAGMPTKAGISISDQLGGQFGLVALIAGMRHARNTGLGLRFDLAMQDATVWATCLAWNAPDRPAPFRIAQTTTGFVILPTDCTMDISGHTREAALNLLATAGIPAAPVLSVSEVLEHPQTRARELILSAPTPDGAVFDVLGTPMRLSRTPARTGGTMAALGHPDPALRRELAALARSRNTRQVPSTVEGLS
ncbi:CaiB/BaiF CoA-transferase family protein [Maritimibacter sp. DP1N21-5]|uniref:CaiB/BaiF CoA-transferase family protein n=1 Tax=Maritimibacter sp. DP1N21-5 TaxID=2836867 RepID=UPI001C4414F2|nr:CaiB/BaiF CoA-transferase family protein [Maritimibacter sp. DP1N21-5]MBV7408550.1 CoA transferase [Maritimibacter sp. DP1N21-5]